MVIHSKELEQVRKKLTELEESNLTSEQYKWEIILDKWLKKNPRGGKYIFWTWSRPSAICLHRLARAYEQNGWATNYHYDRYYICITHD